MAKRAVRTLLTVLGGLTCAFILFAVLVWLFSDGDTFIGGERIARVDITGPITDADAQIKLLKKYAKDERVKAIVLRLDSPGGQVAPAQELYRQIRKIRQDGKPVVASMGSVAASGAYYIACAADKIYANPGTITGSIGVVAQFPNIQQLGDKVGVKVAVIKSGKHKDLGNPFRELAPEEQELLQKVINDVYQQFLDAVAEGRNMDSKSVRRLADGRIFSGRQAKDLGLVDELGGLEETINDTAKSVGIKGEPKVVHEELGRFWWIKYLQGLFSARLPVSSYLEPSGLSVQYRWLY
jgi:protease-4